MQTSSPQNSGPKPQNPSLEQHPVSHFSVGEQVPFPAHAGRTAYTIKDMINGHLENKGGDILSWLWIERWQY